MVIARPMALGRRVALLASTLMLGGCFLDYDKLSSVLDGGAAIAHCGNGMLDGDERDVDCGGSCGLCGADRSCSQDTDCSTGSCVLGLCARASSPPFWLPVATTMPTPRGRLAFTTGPDGQLYAMGGTTSGPVLTTVEAYSLENNQWSARAPMAYARYGFGATTGPDEKLYVLGGGTESVGGGSEFVEAYSPGTNLWTSAPAPAHFNNSAAVTGTDGGIYAFYYYYANGSHLGAQVYRVPPADRWDPLPDPGAASPFATAGLDGRIYVSSNTSLLSIAPGETQWRAEAPSQSGIGNMVAGADGLVYSLASLTGKPTKAEAYSPAARRWSDRAPLTESRSELAATRGPDGRIYVVGGFGTTGALATVEAYGPLLTLSSSMAQPGSSLTLMGQNFAANATVTVTIGSTTVATGPTDANGTLVAPLSFSAPTESGSYRVVAVDNRSVYPVSAPLVVP